MKIDTLALMTGIDIPIPELKVIIHQPTCKEIAMVGREEFLLGSQLLCLDKTSFSQDESLLAETTNFQIFMTIVQDKASAEQKEKVIKALSLFFPNSRVVFSPRGLILIIAEQTVNIDETNFEIFQEYIKEITCFKVSKDDEFNPVDDKAREIAEKLKRGRQRVAAQRAKEGSGDIFTQYLSIITVGIQSMSLNDAMNLTIFQLYDLIERYSMFTSWQLDIKSRLAGAKIEKEPDNLMKEIH